MPDSLHLVADEIHFIWEEPVERVEPLQPLAQEDAQFVQEGDVAEPVRTQKM